MRHYIVLVIVVLSTQVWGQKGLLKSADKYFEAEMYEEALDHYKQYGNIDKDKEAVFKRGVANYYTNNIDDAISDLTAAYTLELEEPLVYYYVGRALHSKGDYSDAVKFYKNYLREIEDKDERSRVVDMIRRCGTGINNQYNEQLAFVENLGPSVNSKYDEVHPVQSPSNQSKYYFSSSRDDATGGRRNSEGLRDEIYGKYSKDMYAVELTDGNWTAVSAFHPLLNSAKDDELMDFSPSGEVMYYLQYRSGQAEMLTDTFSQDGNQEDQNSSVLALPAIAELGDKDLSIFNDSTVLFASRREGGYGGYDLYVSVRANGQWQAPVNMGPQINTQYNEVAPFLAKSGRKLYFSSNSVGSIGGYDIFSAEFSMEGNRWSAASNMGLPINSGRDDLHYSLSADGTVGVFSSDRVDSKGGHDLYMAYMKNQVTDQLMYTEVLPFATDVATQDSLQDVANAIDETSTVGTPSTATVATREYYNTPLYYGSDELVVTPANSSKLDALYDLLVILPETKVLLTAFSVKEGMTEFDLYFSIKRAEKAAAYLVDKGIAKDRLYVRGTGSNFPLAKEMVNGRISRLAQKNNRRVEVTILDAKTGTLDVVPDAPVIAENIRDGAGDNYATVTEGISFKVLISTVKQMYKGDVLKKYNEATIEKRMDSEFYDYTIGVVDKYDEARRLKNELVRTGLTDATIKVYLNGKVLSNSELEAAGLEYPEVARYLQYK